MSGSKGFKNIKLRIKGVSIMENTANKVELNSLTALSEKMYRLGYDDAKNKREFGKSLQEEENVFTYQGQKMEQLTLF